MGNTLSCFGNGNTATRGEVTAVQDIVSLQKAAAQAQFKEQKVCEKEDSKSTDISSSIQQQQKQPAQANINKEAENAQLAAPAGTTQDERPTIDGVPVEDAPKMGLPHLVHYLGPPVCPCDKERLLTVEALEVVDAPPDPELESILKLVQSIFNSPAALVAVFGEKRIFIRNSEGSFGRGDFPWRWSFCGWTMTSRDATTLVIPDATKDARFADNACVTGAPGVRFYCGAPLMASNGHRLGTLCFIDFKARDFDAGNCQILNNLAEMVVRHIEKDIALQLKQHDNTALAAAYQQLKKTMDCVEHCVVLLDTMVVGWKVMYNNAYWEKLTGLKRVELVGKLLSDVIDMPGALQAFPSQALIDMAAKGSEFNVASVIIRGSSGMRKFNLKFRPASKESLDESLMSGVAVPSFLPAKAPGAGDEQGGPRYYFMSVDEYQAPKGSSTSSQTMMFSEGAEVVEGLELGHLLGKGGFGSVYYGTWFGSPVAVKIVDQDIRKLAAQAQQGAAVEAVLGANLRHPNVVATLKSVVRKLGGARSATFSNDTARDSKSGSNSNNGGIVAWGMPNSNGSSGTDTDVLVPAGARAKGLKPKGSGGTHGGVLEEVREEEELASELGPAQPQGAVDSAANATEEGNASDSAATNNLSASQGWAVIDLQMPQSELTSDGNVCSDSQCGTLLPPASSMGTPSFNSLGMCSSSVPNCQTWIIMEHCDRGSLQDAVDRGWLRTVPSAVHGKPRMDAVLATAFEIASALNFMHNQGIIHGDLSAWNVLLTTVGAGTSQGNRGFVAKIADFGMAKSIDIKTKIQTQNYGTVTHMPPETMLEGTISRAVDVYSFGVLLWQMFTGSRPWAGLSHGQIIAMVATKGAQLQFPSTTPQDFRDLAMACMDQDPAHRPPFNDICRRLDDMRRALGEAV